ncbi:hypothetical protein [Actinokineospora sp. HUAS TT18]|uniref:hypothetical protein n=1 Tax=Actinokineospora sp. HUAS TT18 TaxID=3447451 RepID=UPI003F51E24C
MSETTTTRPDPVGAGEPAFDRIVRSLHGARSWLWLVFAVPAGALAGLIMLVLPPHQELANIADWAFRLSPFVFAVLAVAVLPRGRFGPALFLLATLFYMGVLDTGLVERILAYGKNVADPEAFVPVYQFELLTVTYVTLFALMAYRLGGARTAVVLKTGIAAVLVVISGLNDFTFWMIHTFANGKPTHFTWATHMIVFLGGPPSVLVAGIFVVVHLGLAAAIACLPLARWVDRAVARPEALA